MFFIIIFQSSIPLFPLDIEKGRERTDFSDGAGFYLSDDHLKAAEWGKKITPVGGCFAVLRYKIAKQTLETEDGLFFRIRASKMFNVGGTLSDSTVAGKKLATQSRRNFLRKLVLANIALDNVIRLG